MRWRLLGCLSGPMRSLQRILDPLQLMSSYPTVIFSSSPFRVFWVHRVLVSDQDQMVISDRLMDVRHTNLKGELIRTGSRNLWSKTNYIVIKRWL